MLDSHFPSSSGYEGTPSWSPAVHHVTEAEHEAKPIREPLVVVVQSLVSHGDEVIRLGDSCEQ